MSDALELALDNLFERLQALPEPLETEYDADWPSPCEQGQPRGTPEMVTWQPVRRELPNDFAGLENALEFEIHPDIKTYYGRYWAANVAARAADGDLSLLFLWNPEDIDRLIENLIGHAVACRNNKTPYAVFFAVTEPDAEYFLSVHNDTGAVQLEKPGYKPQRQLANSLAEFVDSLTPTGTAAS
ncbi:MAG: SecY-interacting protein Syd [Pseudomonadota bacterium]